MTVQFPKRRGDPPPATFPPPWLRGDPHQGTFDTLEPTETGWRVLEQLRWDNVVDVDDPRDIEPGVAAAILGDIALGLDRIAAGASRPMPDLGKLDEPINAQSAFASLVTLQERGYVTLTALGVSIPTDDPDRHHAINWHDLVLDAFAIHNEHHT